METIRPIPEYVDKARNLAVDARELLLARSQSRFSRKPGYLALQPLERVALLLQFEEQSLREWQVRVMAMRQVSTYS